MKMKKAKDQKKDSFKKELNILLFSLINLKD